VPPDGGAADAGEDVAAMDSSAADADASADAEADADAEAP
jgi:hypothetical protein